MLRARKIYRCPGLRSIPSDKVDSLIKAVMIFGQRIAEQEQATLIDFHPLEYRRGISYYNVVIGHRRGCDLYEYTIIKLPVEIVSATGSRAYYITNQR